MIVVDANLLLYAYNAAAREHKLARAWFEATLSSEPAIGLPLVSVLAFIRITTDRRLPETAYTPKEAADVVNTWLSRDNVAVLEPGPEHWPIFFETLAATQTSGPRVTDAHLAALTIEHGGTFYTNDGDFRKFPRLDVRFPLADRA